MIKKLNILILYPNLRLHTKRFVPCLLCILTFRGPLQELQSRPAFASPALSQSVLREYGLVNGSMNQCVFYNNF